MSDAVSGVGTVLKRGDGASSESFVALSEVNEINGPSMDREQIEVTSLDSTGGYREYIGGFRDGGEVVLNMNWTRDNFITLVGDFEDDDETNFQIVFPDDGETTLDFAGLVTSVPVTIPTDDKITMNVTIKVTGQVSISS